MITDKKFKWVLAGLLAFILSVSGVVLALTKTHKPEEMDKPTSEGAVLDTRQASIQCIPIKATITINDKSTERSFVRCFIIVEDLAANDTNTIEDTAASDTN